MDSAGKDKLKYRRFFHAENTVKNEFEYVDVNVPI